MNMKIVSLDVWNTLLAPNPEYSKVRNQYLAKELSLPIDIIKAAYQKVKSNSDKMAEQRSMCLSNEDIYKKFLSSIGRQDYNWIKLRQTLETLFAQYPPYVLPTTIEYLNLLQEKGIELSIASNTNFIRGEIIHDVLLSRWGIDWKFQVFSDRVKRPKPHSQFWEVVTNKAQKYAGAMPENILHIGDNKICDGSCVQSNIQFHHIIGPSNLVETLECV